MAAGTFAVGGRKHSKALSCWLGACSALGLEREWSARQWQKDQCA